MTHTVAHVTHEAVEHIGGIGTVLQGLITSPAYRERVGRTILVGPTSTHVQVEPEQRLGADGRVLYSSADGIDRTGVGDKLRPIEWAFNVSVVYGTRRYHLADDDRTGDAEVLLIDVFRPSTERLNVFKLSLWEHFGLDSTRYERDWGYEQYVRLAEPAYYALRALLGEEDLPCVLLAHEFMGMPTALQVVLEDRHERFRTVFYGHECATARHLVENNPGHDTMFYNVLSAARRRGLFVEDVFGDLSGLFRHELVRRAHLCDGVAAVGGRVSEELAFLEPRFAEKPIDLVFNGVPAGPVPIDEKRESRKRVDGFAAAHAGSAPDWLFTHVTRPVVSKGLWRDLAVCDALEPMLAARGETAWLLILTTAGGVRGPQHVAEMERAYNWPLAHRHGYPDLVGPEVGIAEQVAAFNGRHERIRAVLVNQFGFSRERVGESVPAGTSTTDLRRAADVELGMATYEPFGISPLEPLAAGALCVISSVCGCGDFVAAARTGEPWPENVVVGDFTALEDAPGNLEKLKAIGRPERDGVEARVAGEIARTLDERLPRDEATQKRRLEEGGALAAAMGWDRVVEDRLLPLLDRIR